MTPQGSPKGNVDGLRVADLAVARGGLTLWRGVSFGVPAGTALLLRGPNGTGKTTLLRALAGLQPLQRGQISLPPDVFAYAAHADGVKAVLTVEENLAFWAALHATAALEPALRQMALWDLRKRPAGHLSAGQKRRLGLARLLVTGRSIWLLDEPTVSLDQASVALFDGMLRDHLSSGGSAVIATHVDLGIPAPVLDLAAFRTVPSARVTGFDEPLA